MKTNSIKKLSLHKSTEKTLRTKTNVKAGAGPRTLTACPSLEYCTTTNHNQSLKIKTKIKAGDVYLHTLRGSNNRLNDNHNQRLR